MKKGEVDSCWGWVIVAAAALNRIVIYGVSYSAGVVYVVVLEVFDEGSGMTSWISSLITAVLFFTCPLSGYLIRKFGERKVTVAGSLIAAIGMTSSAFVNSVPALIVTYGIISGFGCGLAFMPGSVAVAKYFKNQRHVALAIASAGGGIGSFAFPPLIEFLNEYYTWRGMFLILGGITLNMCVFGLLFRPLKKKDKSERVSQESGYSSEKSESHSSGERKRKDEIGLLNKEPEELDQLGFFDRHFYFKIPTFYILLLNNFMFQFGASVVYGHLQAYAVYELSFTKTNAALLYTITGIMVLIFKLLHGIFANIARVRIFRPIYQYMFFYFIGGVATLCLTINTRYGVYFYSIILGMSYAACGGSLLPSLLIDFAGVELLGLVYGVTLLGLSLGQLVGAPVAGVLYENMHSYNVPFILAGTMMAGSSIIMIYPCRTDLNPEILLNQPNEKNMEIEIGDTVTIHGEPLQSEVFDPISASMVRGSGSSLHRLDGYLGSFHSLHKTKKCCTSSQVIHYFPGFGDSLNSLEIGPRSSSFSIQRQKSNESSSSAPRSDSPKCISNSLSQCKPLSPLAIDN